MPTPIGKRFTLPVLLLVLLALSFDGYSEDTISYQGTHIYPHI